MTISPSFQAKITDYIAYIKYKLLLKLFIAVTCKGDKMREHFQLGTLISVCDLWLVLIANVKSVSVKMGNSINIIVAPFRLSI